MTNKYTIQYDDMEMTFSSSNKCVHCFMDIDYKKPFAIFRCCGNYNGLAAEYQKKIHVCCYNQLLSSKSKKLKKLCLNCRKNESVSEVFATKASDLVTNISYIDLTKTVLDTHVNDNINDVYRMVDPNRLEFLESEIYDKTEDNFNPIFHKRINSRKVVQVCQHEVHDKRTNKVRQCVYPAKKYRFCGIHAKAVINRLY